MKTSLKINTIFTLVSLLIVILANSTALAQTFDPPQIPDYNLPTGQDGSITIPSEPSNPGVGGTQPTIAPIATPEPEPDYGLIFLAIIIGSGIAGTAIIWIAWTITKKRKAAAPSIP